MRRLIVGGSPLLENIVLEDRECAFLTRGVLENQNFRYTRRDQRASDGNPQNFGFLMYSCAPHPEQE